MIAGTDDDQLRLRPAAEDELPILQRLTQDPEAAGQYSWYGWFDMKRWQRRWADNELIGDDLGVRPSLRTSPTRRHRRRAGFTREGVLREIG